MSKSINKTATRLPETFAYVRVSTREQNEDRQLIALEPYNIPLGNIFVEKKSVYTLTGQSINAWFAR